jgi:hypothetical protein
MHVAKESNDVRCFLCLMHPSEPPFEQHSSKCLDFSLPKIICDVQSAKNAFRICKELCKNTSYKNYYHMRLVSFLLIFSEMKSVRNFVFPFLLNGGASLHSKKIFRVPTGSYPIYTLFIQCTNHSNAFFKSTQIGKKNKRRSYHL